ncbi:MAG TPA: TonB family protein [Burkholderiales bacterium]|nr:TonB family protein [Burkholderiales bacterium]
MVASLLLHGMFLSLRFTFPGQLRWHSSDQALEVILVNSSSRQRPARSDALAQANLEGGGTAEDERRAKTPLPVIDPRLPGSDLAQAERRVRELEALQRKLLTQARKPAPGVSAGDERRAPADRPTPPRAGRDETDLSLAAMRLQAEIARNLEAYQKRPRKKFIGASAVEYRFAQYEEDWRRKIERIGTDHYPVAARGKVYGNLRMTVTLGADGSVAAVELDRSSGTRVLDDAAFRIVRMASPYAPFPPDIRRDTDQIVITRTWFFDRGDHLRTE